MANEDCDKLLLDMIEVGIIVGHGPLDATLSLLEDCAGMGSCPDRHACSPRVSSLRANALQPAA